MIRLWTWVARLPVVRSQIYHPVIYLRGDALTEVRRYGVMPDGSEVDLGSTVMVTLKHAKFLYETKLFDVYRRWSMRPAKMVKNPLRFIAPIRVEGTDFAPLPKL